MGIDEALSEEEALSHLDSLLENVPAPEAPGVMTQALWFMPPWSTFTPYLRLMFRRLGERFGEQTGPGNRALALCAHGRASIVDRRFVHAIAECEQALEEALEGGSHAMQRSCRALRERARLQAGRTAQALDAVEGWDPRYEPHDPTDLGFETLLTLGLVHMTTGELEAALESFDAVVGLSEGAEEGDLAEWHRAVALGGRGHALFRQSRPSEAVDPVEEALRLARQNHGTREAADLLVMRSVCSLASGEERAASDLDEVASLVSGFPGSNGAVDLYFGLPADLGGGKTTGEMAQVLFASAEERASSMDPHGFAIAILGMAGLLRCEGASDKALLVLEAAPRALESAQVPELIDAMEAARSVIKG